MVRAVQNAKFDLLKTVIGHGENLELRDTNGWTATHHASRTRWEGVQSIKILLAVRADGDALTHRRKTPLCIAIENRHYEMVNSLKGHGASVGQCED
jgi:ankyrin repeat protein